MTARGVSKYLGNGQCRCLLYGENFFFCLLLLRRMAHPKQSEQILHSSLGLNKTYGARRLKCDTQSAWPLVVRAFVTHGDFIRQTTPQSVVLGGAGGALLAMASKHCAHAPCEAAGAGGRALLEAPSNPLRTTDWTTAHRMQSPRVTSTLALTVTLAASSHALRASHYNRRALYTAKYRLRANLFASINGQVV